MSRGVYDRCIICSDFHWSGRPCKPVFELAYDDWYGEGEWIAVRGIDAQDAAENWAEQSDAEGDYTIIGGSDVVVKIRDGAGDVKEFNVSGESQPVYHAEETEYCELADCPSTGLAKMVWVHPKLLGDEASPRIGLCRACCDRMEVKPGEPIT